jgi:hypothetical protein
MNKAMDHLKEWGSLSLSMEPFIAKGQKTLKNHPHIVLDIPA